MKLSIDGKVPDKFWYFVGIALLAIAGASRDAAVRCPSHARCGTDHYAERHRRHRDSKEQDR